MSVLSRLKKLIGAQGALRKRALVAGAWSMLSIGVQQPLRLASNLVLTRILVPEDFGLMAVVLVVHMGLELLSDVGLRQSVIRSDRGEEALFLRVVWTVQIVRSVAILGLLLAIAGAVWALGPRYAGADTVYADPVLPYLLAVSGISVLCKGLNSTAGLMAKRKMLLGRVTAVQIIGQVAGIIVMIVACFALESVWGLLIGQVIGSMISLTLTHTMIPGPRMALAWDRTQTGEMWSFGKWLIPSSVGEFMAGNSDRLLFAALLDKEVFGLYAVAFIWVQAGSQIVNRLAGSIFLPVFSEVKRNHAAGFGRMVRRSYAVNAGLSLLLFAATFLVGVYVVGHLYVGPFAEVGVLVAAMAFKVLFLSFRPLMQVILSEGDSRYVGITQLSRGLLVVAAILIGAELGSIPYAILLQIVIVAGPIAFMLVHPMVAQRISPRITLVHLALLVGATVAYFQLEGIAGIAALTR